MIKSARRFAVAAGVLALAGLAASPASSQSSPWGPPGDAAYKPFDVTYQNYHFRDGETLPSLRVHYLTLGTPHRDARGQIDNAVLVLHWTGADSKAVTTQAYTKSLYDAGRPLDASRYFLIFPDAIGSPALDRNRNSDFYNGHPFVCGDQSDRTSAPINPHVVQTIFGHRDRRGVSSGSQSAFTTAL
jgi:hypothetical protein